MPEVFIQHQWNLVAKLVLLDQSVTEDVVCHSSAAWVNAREESSGTTTALPSQDQAALRVSRRNATHAAVKIVILQLSQLLSQLSQPHPDSHSILFEQLQTSTFNQDSLTVKLTALIHYTPVYSLYSLYSLSSLHLHSTNGWLRQDVKDWW